MVGFLRGNCFGFREERISERKTKRFSPPLLFVVERITRQIYRITPPRQFRTGINGFL